MTKILIIAALLASSPAFALTKSVTRSENDKHITVTTRTAPAPSVFTFMIHRMPVPAPRNACDTPTSSAFEIVTRDVVKCVGRVNR